MPPFQSTLLMLRQVRQRGDWDCGLACAEMVLAWATPNAREDAVALAHAVRTRSIWTVDLVELLRARLGDRITFHSLVLETSLHLAHDAFYTRDYLDDMARIQPLFNAVVAAKCARRGSVSIDALRDALANRDHVALVLIDARELTCCVQLPRSGTFQGHFIVVASISARGVAYVDPASPEHPCCWMSLESFEAARKSHGTDEDIILIRR
ncbi:hypothetical protein SPRG_20477 [Saprolegnia parasitica CBS 223.65]|uniref:Peptidase C39 domain-containing protein n=1 Tax=Saprolegnia parasitica (strain CBS 223.65) TaxID=695850 RepID=A0A067C875_SAPPC|nr:hypothetical protein SPRG_20477 [Saprolegnia parasitica CBS 223.65]KDO26673.1 hypothetical protein SPRG_20477 [Saprolegnia parasitica CBS 223.65]|eukprot:XP_012202571.1 hypothetical protein SPRG_20477 [Saprolegnia parasitica CBS 223.65]